MTKLTPIQKIARGSRYLAAALVAAASVRFAVVAVEAAVDNDQVPETTPSAPAPTTSTRGRPPGAASGDRPSRPPAKPGTPIQVQLLVNVGNERSELYIDGVKIGSSPFLGTISCDAGKKLAIEVLITKGVVYSYERTCEPGTIRVDTAP